MTNKIRATLVAIGCAGALVAVPASSVASTTQHIKCGTGPYGSYATCKHVKPKLTGAKASGWQQGRFTFKFTLMRGSSKAFGIKSFKVTLPKGITWDKKNLKKDVVVGGKHTVKLDNKSTITVTLPDQVVSVPFMAKSGATMVSRSARDAYRITVKIDATDGGHKTYPLSFSAHGKKHHKKHHHHHHHH